MKGEKKDACGPAGSGLPWPDIRTPGRRHMQRRAQPPDKNRAFLCAVFTEVQRKCIRHFRGSRGCRKGCVKPPHLRAVPGGRLPGKDRLLAADRKAFLRGQQAVADNEAVLRDVVAEA